jgi:hypothetical protein
VTQSLASHWNGPSVHQSSLQGAGEGEGTMMTTFFGGGGARGDQSGAHDGEERAAALGAVGDV